MFVAACGLYFFTTRQTHPQLSVDFTLAQPASFFEATSNCPLVFPSSILDTFQPGSSSSGVISFCLFILFMEFSGKWYWSGFPFLPSVAHVLSELSLWPIHLQWPCLTWLLASFSCTSPFTMTRLQSMNGAIPSSYCPISLLLKAKFLWISL